MQEFLVGYRNKLFSGYRVISAANEKDAADYMTKLGYNVVSVVLAVCEE